MKFVRLPKYSSEKSCQVISACPGPGGAAKNHAPLSNLLAQMLVTVLFFKYNVSMLCIVHGSRQIMHAKKNCGLSRVTATQPEHYNA